MKRVRITFTPYPEDADEDNSTGLTNDAFERIFDVIPGEDIEVVLDDEA